MKKHFCNKPKYHPEYVNKVGAAILFLWFHQDERRIIPERIAPLCEFGGVAFSEHSLDEAASGTYAVCPKCQKVHMGGYDSSGLVPKHCVCGTQFTNADYFQSVGGECQDQEDFFHIETAQKLK